MRRALDKLKLVTIREMEEKVKHMKAIFTLPAAEKKFLEKEIPIPKIENERDLLVEVQAISVNPVDIKQSQQLREPRILGFDASGIVKQIGKKCQFFKEGDQVFYSRMANRSGSNTQYQLIDERFVGTKPAIVDYALSAAIPLTSLTAWEALTDRLMIKQLETIDQSILIINGAGGVGSIAIQLAKYLGLKVITTASRKETAKWVKEMGADIVINHHHSLVEQLNQQKIRNVDYILCLYNTNFYWEEMSQLIKPEGKICSIVGTNQPIDLEKLKDKSVSFSWEYMFTRSKYQTKDREKQHEILEKISKLYDQKQLKTTTTKTLQPINANNLEKAYQLVASGKMIGKLTLSGWY